MTKEYTLVDLAVYYVAGILFWLIVADSLTDDIVHDLGRVGLLILAMVPLQIIAAAVRLKAHPSDEPVNT